MLATGLLLAAIAVDVIRVDPTSVHAPRWVVFTIGLVFVLAGVSAFVGVSSRARDLLAAIVLLAMSAVGGWVSLFGASGSFSGGLPILSRGVNVVLGRTLIGFGAIVTFVLSVYAMRRGLRRDA